MNFILIAVLVLGAIALIAALVLDIAAFGENKPELLPWHQEQLSCCRRQEQEGCRSLFG